MFEDNGIDSGKVDDRKRNNEAGNNSPEQEAIVIDGMEDSQPALVFCRVEVEEGSREMLDFPGGDEEEEGQYREDGGSGTKDGIAIGVVDVVAFISETAIIGAVNDSNETDEAKGA